MIQCTCGRWNKTNKEKCLCGMEAVVSLVKGLKEFKRKSVKKVSEKRQTINELYPIVRQIYLALVPVCEFQGCHEMAYDIHHKAGRQGNNQCIPFMIDMQNFMACCRDHHTWIENNGNEAIEKGYSIRRTNL